MKTLLLLPVLAFLLFSCKKPTHEPDSVIDPVAHVPEDKQFIHLVANGKDILWIENDTVSIDCYSSYSVDPTDSTSDRILSFYFYFKFRFTKFSYRSGEAIYFSLDTPIPAREAVSFYVDECKYTKPAYIQKVFFPGLRKISSLKPYCIPASMRYNASVGYNLYDRTEKTQIIYDKRTTDQDLCTQVLNQEGSYVEITYVRPFKHPLRGDGWMVDVKYKANLYNYDYTNPYTDSKLGIGSGRVFVKECKD